MRVSSCYRLELSYCLFQVIVLVCSFSFDPFAPMSVGDFGLFKVAVGGVVLSFVAMGGFGRRPSFGRSFVIAHASGVLW
jgi:hypothetical protein